jgi:hypothetical protein
MPRKGKLTLKRQKGKRWVIHSARLAHENIHDRYVQLVDQNGKWTKQCIIRRPKWQVNEMHAYRNDYA